MGQSYLMRAAPCSRVNKSHACYESYLVSRGICSGSMSRAKLREFHQRVIFVSSPHIEIFKPAISSTMWSKHAVSSF